jgi:hypothetical protein
VSGLGGGVKVTGGPKSFSESIMREGLKLDPRGTGDFAMLVHPDTAKLLWPKQAHAIDAALEQGDRERYAAAVRFWSGPFARVPDALTICDCLPRQLACNAWTCEGCVPRPLFGFGGPW